MDNELWLGYKSGHFWFKVPEYYEEKKTDFKVDENGQKWRRLGNISWFTNMEIEKRHQLTKSTFDPKPITVKQSKVKHGVITARASARSRIMEVIPSLSERSISPMVMATNLFY